jgi:hypothetical protein
VSSVELVVIAFWLLGRGVVLVGVRKVLLGGDQKLLLVLVLIRLEVLDTWLGEDKVLWSVHGQFGRENILWTFIHRLLLGHLMHVRGLSRILKSLFLLKLILTIQSNYNLL